MGLAATGRLPPRMSPGVRLPADASSLISLRKPAARGEARLADALARRRSRQRDRHASRVDLECTRVPHGGRNTGYRIRDSPPDPPVLAYRMVALGERLTAPKASHVATSGPSQQNQGGGIRRQADS